MTDRLSPLDVSFLSMETPTTAMPDIDVLAACIEQSLADLVATLS